MIPKRSPWGLIQEDLWPNSWLILVSCVMLNCTSRKQAEKVMPEFIKRYSTPEDLLKEDKAIIVSLIAPLGFKNRRTECLYKLANAYIDEGWNDPRDLPGIGEYGARSWEIFCENKLGKEVPKDGALRVYWEWRMINGTVCSPAEEGT